MSKPNTIDTLRTELFDTLRRLKDKDAPMDVARAKAVVEVASVIVDTAKVEIAFLEATGATGTGFIPNDDRKALPTMAPGPRALAASR
jgi:hypothetical protein